MEKLKEKIDNIASKKSELENKQNQFCKIIEDKITEKSNIGNISTERNEIIKHTEIQIKQLEELNKKLKID